MTSFADNELDQLRDELRVVDDQLMELICRRVDIVRQIGAIKISQSLPILDSHRERLNKEKNLDVVAGRAPAAFIDDLTDLLAKWSRHIQSAQP